MRSFESLTVRGKARRLRELALEALKRYDLDVAEVSLLGMFTNALFRLRTTDGTSYVLRVCSPGWRSDTDLLSEALWLQALARDTDIGAPLPLAARDGAWLVRAATPGVSGGSRCMVLSWVPGRPLGRHLTAPNLEKMGALFARLHAHGAAFVPPEGFTALRLDRLLARGETDVLFAGETWAGLPPDHRARLEQVRAAVDAAYTRRYSGPAAPQVIHNDLWHDNIHLYRGRLYPLDFEDTCWGYPVQDLAMALQDLMDDTEPAEFEPLQAALRRGYERLSPWPEEYEGEADSFRAGRTLWVANFVAAHQREYLAPHLARMAPLWDRFLATGSLRKG